MRGIAIVLAACLASPPELDERVTDAPVEESLDCMLGGCEEEEVFEGNSEPAEVERPSAEALKAEARGLVVAGKLREGIAVFEQAYHLDSSDHIIAYEIASAAQKMGDCERMRKYLTHFLRHADHGSFPSKRSKASRALAAVNASGCPSASDREVNEASAAGKAAANKVARDNDSRLLTAGVVLVGIGVIALGAGIALVALSGGGGSAGPNCVTGKRCGNTCIEVSDMCHIMSSAGAGEPNLGFLGGGAALIVAGVGVTTGGGVIISRSMSQPSRYITFSPGGLVLRF
ncbi:MAG: hypothetical protein R6X02_28230 [Enhygromyxa sp.]